MAILIYLCSSIVAQAQQSSDSLANNREYIAAIKPSKVTFYSAVLPGLGQVANRDYWKVPVVYGVLGASIYSAVYNDNRYQNYREAFRLLKLGQPNEYPDLNQEVLQRAQRFHKKNRDLMIIVTGGFYVLQILEASVDAHLQYHNVEQDLSLSPYIRQTDDYGGSVAMGIGIRYTF